MTKFLPFLLFISIASKSYSQYPDSLQINVGSIGTIASNGYQPLWLVANRWGAITDRQYDASTYAGFSNINYFGKTYISKSNPTGIAQPEFYVKYGANIINNNQFKDIILQEAYVKAGYKHLEIRAGRFKYIPGEVDQDLSSGSLGVSGNALPIPQITIALTDYVDVPFTNGWLQIKAELSHGWLGGNRYLNSYYHEKNLYLRAGKNKFKFFIGAQHYAEWGGQRSDVQLDRSFNGFLNVLFAKNGADDGSGIDPSAIAIYGPYHAGDQRGLIEFGFDLETNQHRIHFYHQTPFDGPEGVDIRNIDNLSGISVTSKNKSLLQKVLAEFIYTRQQENYAPASTRQGLYNNGYYRTGWEYNNMIIGTPLFINRQRAQDYTYFQQQGVKPFDWSNSNNSFGNSNIIFNSIMGGNIGLLLQFSSKLSGKTKLTYTSGKFQGSINNLNQFYSLQELYYSVAKSLNISAGFALDAGSFSHNTGGLIGLHWQFKKNWQK